jgi:hypothetical protein
VGIKTNANYFCHKELKSSRIGKRVNGKLKINISSFNNGYQQKY